MQYLLAGRCGKSGQAFGGGLRKSPDTVYRAKASRREETILGTKGVQSDGNLEARSSIIASSEMPPIP